MVDSTALNPERWLDEHGDVLFRYALTRLGNVEQAEDLVQETLVAALEGREAYAGRASERNWLMGILKHKIIDQLRRRFREQPVSDLAAEEAGEAPLEDFFDRLSHWRRKPSAWSDPRAALEEQDFWGVLDRCVDALPGRWAKVFQLRILEQFSLEEAQRIMEASSTNMGVLLHRARLRIRECLQVNWFQNPKEKKKR